MFLLFLFNMKLVEVEKHKTKMFLNYYYQLFVTSLYWCFFFSGALSPPLAKSNQSELMLSIL